VSRLDAQDLKILRVLQTDGRISMAELADRVGLSTSPCWRRARQLEEAGVIEGYAARVSPEALGLSLNVFVYVSLDLHNAEAFEAEIQERDEVVECYAMTGDKDYLLHVMVADIEAFDRFLRRDLIIMPGVERVNTSFALKAIKKTSALPLPDAPRTLRQRRA
jgi:DNA-binding Lrp family transcriptional regulator